MARQANDAAAQSPSRGLPSPSFTRDATPPFIDLSSPTNSPKSPIQRKPRADATRPRLTQARRSDDEKRLVGDFSTPADAVALPDPQSWMTRTESGQGTMSKKPGSEASFKPVNTINDVNPGAGQRRQITYGKHDRQYPPSIGQTRHEGQMAWLAHEKSRAPITPARNPSSREEHARPSGGASSGKRRKIEHVTDLDDDSSSEVREVFPPSAPHTPAGTFCEKPPSAKSSQSQFSIGSGCAVTGSKRASQPKSEFGVIDSITRSHRKKARKPGSNGNKGTQQTSPFGGGLVSGSVKAHIRTAPIEVPDDEIVDRAKFPRRQILQDFQQGWVSRSSAERKQPSRKPDTATSHHFSSMRINESTSEQTANNRYATSDATELHKQYRPASSKSTVMDLTEDELAMPNANETPRKRVSAPSKARQAANSGVKRKAHNSFDSKVWPLCFARTYHYEGRGFEMDDGHYDLVLRIDPDVWRIEHISETKVEIKSSDVIRANTDGVSRIRLEGPRRQDGNSHVFDLEFAKTQDLQSFRDEYAVSWTTLSKVFIRSESIMMKMFSKDLSKNDKVGTSELVYDSILDADNHDEQNNKVSKTPLLDQLKSITPDVITNEGSNKRNGFTTALSATRTSTRPARSTKSSARNYDLEGALDDKTVEKFSIDVGLGSRWVKPLDYGRGRQRAVVHFDDLPRLDEEEFMNDSLIDFYMIYLFNKLNVPTDKVYFFNTYFFTQLTKNTGRQSMNYKAVERWTSKIDVFSYDYIVVPINEATHWYLAIICNVSNIDRKPVVEDFDNDLAEATEHNRKDLANQTTIGEHATDDALQLVESPSLFNDSVEDPSEQIDDDPNLFDEESKINLVNREDTGAEDGLQVAKSQTRSVPHSRAAETAHTAQVASDAGAEPKGILSDLTASLEKKKIKRKPIQPKKDPTQPIILILDSLGQTRSGTVRALKDWLAAEGEAKRGMEATIKEKGYYPKASQIPMQNNWTDCGVYLLGYVEKFFQNPDEFKTELLTGEMSAEEDWPELKPREMRKNMREIIFKFAEEQKATKKEERKPKRVVARAKPSPPPVEHEPVKSEPKISQPEQFSPERSKSSKTKRAETQNTNSEQAEPNAQPTIDLPKPRLASPFRLDPQSAQISSRSHTPEVVGKVSDSPPITTSTIKPVSTTPRLEQTPRGKRPEVHILVQTPQSAVSMCDGQTTSVGMTHLDEQVPQKGDVSRTLSPSKRRRQDENDGQLRLPNAKRRSTRSPQQQGRDRSVRSSPLMGRSREGSAGQPIAIEDSQAVKPLGSRTPNHQQSGLPAQRKPPSRSPRRPQIIRHSPSVEEIPPPIPRIAERNHRHFDERRAGHELEAKLDESDEERNRLRRLRARSPTKYAPRSTLERAEEAAFQSMDTGSYDGDVVDIDETLQDTVVRETPEPNRRSPSMWMSGDPLPL